MEVEEINDKNQREKNNMPRHRKKKTKKTPAPGIKPNRTTVPLKFFVSYAYGIYIVSTRIRRERKEGKRMVLVLVLGVQGKRVRVIPVC